MSGNDKWLDQLTSRATLCDAARVAIPLRLQAVAWRIPRALLPGQTSVEHVHQLRVATRRCQAALSLFRDVLPRAPHEELKQQLQQIRRAAAAVRDADVLMAQLHDVSIDTPTSTDDRDAIVGLLREDRERSHARFAAELQVLATPLVRRHWRQFVGRVRWRGDVSEPLWRDSCQQVLRKLGKRWHRAALALPADPAIDTTDFSHLHQLRIAGKRLRYSMELSAGAFPGALLDLYQFIAQSQRFLGDINDGINAHQFLTECASKKRFQPLSDPILVLAECQYPLLQRNLMGWTEWWHPSGLENFWQKWREVVGGKLGARKKGA